MGIDSQVVQFKWPIDSVVRVKRVPSYDWCYVRALMIDSHGIKWCKLEWFWNGDFHSEWFDENDLVASTPPTLEGVGEG